MQVKLTADVMCDWFGYEPIYRVYVDGYLITERSYTWNNQYEFIREHVVVDISPGTHTFVVEPILFPGSNATFKIQNFTVNGSPASLAGSTFTI